MSKKIKNFLQFQQIFKFPTFCLILQIFLIFGTKNSTPELFPLFFIQKHKKIIFFYKNFQQSSFIYSKICKNKHH